MPALYYLAGLTCNEEHLPTKGGALALAAELGHHALPWRSVI